jgi:hypothetical protein
MDGGRIRTCLSPCARQTTIPDAAGGERGGLGGEEEMRWGGVSGTLRGSRYDAAGGGGAAVGPAGDYLGGG